MKKRWLIVVILAYVIVRIYIAALSSYGFYHGWNEGWYSLIARNYFSGSFWEQIAYPGSEPFSSAPPFFSYLVYVSFKIFGVSDISARLVSILSEVIALLGVYILAKELYNEKIASIATIIFIFIPWNILWFGRAQTDPLMTALMTLAIAIYVRAYKNDKSMLPFGITLGLAVFTKQPTLAALPIVLIWSYFQGIKKNQIIRAFMYFLLGLIPLCIWQIHNVLFSDPSILFDFIYPYGKLLYKIDFIRIIIATTFGISPLILICSIYTIYFNKNSLIVAWIIILGVFVLFRAPASHDYYSLILIPPIAISAAAGIVRLNKKYLLSILIISTIPVTYVMLSFTGDLGYTSIKDVNEYLNSNIVNNPDESYLILTPVKYTPQMEWYSRNIKIYSIGDQSLEEIEKIVINQNQTSFLLIDNLDFRQERAELIYEKKFIETYTTAISATHLIPNTLILYKMNNKKLR